MSNRFTPFEHMTFSIYRCNDCQDKRSVTNIPAMIDGVIKDDIQVADHCSSCKSTDITTLFSTKSADEFAVYCQIVALEDEVAE
jgi:hypothetical protein